MGVYKQTRHITSSMAVMETAIEELDAEAAKIETKLKKLASELTVNREQRQRLVSGMNALRNSQMKEG